MTHIKRKEFQELERGRKVDHPVIAISGLSGSGKGTHSQLLQQKLKEDYGIKLPIYESGQFFRELADKAGMAPSKYSTYLKENPKISDEVDKTIDLNVLKSAIKGPGIYVGRLTTYIIGENGYGVFLKADLDLVAERIAKDPKREEKRRGLSKEQIKEDLVKRDNADKKRYGKLYGIKYDSDVPSAADIIVTNDKPPEEVFRKFYGPLTKWMKEKGYVKA